MENGPTISLSFVKKWLSTIEIIFKGCMNVVKSTILLGVIRHRHIRAHRKVWLPCVFTQRYLYSLYKLLQCTVIMRSIKSETEKNR